MNHSSNTRKAKPLIPCDVKSHEPRFSKGPALSDPARNEHTQECVKGRRDEIVHHPPADVGIGPLSFRRIDVDASGQASLFFVQQGVVEGSPLDHFVLMPCQIGSILFESHRLEWPSPWMPKGRPEALSRTHDCWVVDADVRCSNGTEMMLWRHSEDLGWLKVRRKPGVHAVSSSRLKMKSRSSRCTRG
jgi:hypothetical protein